MSYWSSASDNARARGEDIGRVLLELRGLFFSLSESYRWRPADGSLAASDALRLPMPDPRLTDDREAGFWLISEAINSYLVMAAGHLAAAGVLYRGGEVFFGLGPVMRAAAESCARALSLLPRPSEPSADARLARACLERLASAKQALTSAASMSEPNSEVAKERQHLLAELIVDIRRVFPEASNRSLEGKSNIIGRYKRPQIEEAVKAMHAFTVEFAGASIDRRDAAGIYNFLSDLSHPSLYTVHDMRVLVPSGQGDGVFESRLEIDADFLDRLARYATLCFYLVVTGTVSYFGWPRTEVTEMESRLNDVLPGVFSS